MRTQDPGGTPARRRTPNTERPARSDAVEITRLICQTVGGIAALLTGAFLALRGKDTFGYIVIGTGAFLLAPGFVSTLIKSMIERALKEALSQHVQEALRTAPEDNNEDNP